MNDKDSLKSLDELKLNLLRKSWGWLDKYMDIEPSFYGFHPNASQALNELKHDKQVVVLLHGFQTHATWQEMVKNVLRVPEVIEVVPTRYGFFDFPRFWLPGPTRQGPIQEVLHKMRHAMDNNKDCRLSVIAHSFGTYVITKILEDNPDIHLFRLILCASIVPGKYRWDKLQRQIDSAAINDCGTKDFWPVLARCGSWGYGDSGTFGFGSPGVTDRFHNFAHSAYFEEKFVKRFWKPYIQNGDIIPSSWDTGRPTPPWLLSALSKVPLKYIIVVLIAGILVLLGLLARFLGL